MIIIGLQHCNDESGLTFAGNMINEVWKTCSKIIIYTSSLESSRQLMKELASTLLDKIAKTTAQNKVTVQ